MRDLWWMWKTWKAYLVYLKVSKPKDPRGRESMYLGSLCADEHSSVDIPVRAAVQALKPGEGTGLKVQAPP